MSARAARRAEAGRPREGREAAAKGEAATISSSPGVSRKRQRGAAGRSAPAGVWRALPRRRFQKQRLGPQGVLGAAGGKALGEEKWAGEGNIQGDSLQLSAERPRPGGLSRHLLSVSAPRHTWVQIPAPPPSSCEVSDKSLSLSVLPQFRSPAPMKQGRGPEGPAQAAATGLRGAGGSATLHTSRALCCGWRGPSPLLSSSFPGTSQMKELGHSAQETPL